MIANSPQTKLNELIRRLSVFDVRNQPNDIEFRSLLNEAAKLRKVDAFEGLVLSGLIHATRNNYKESKENFESALKISSDSLAVLNYSAVLSTMGKHEESLKIIEKYYSPDDKEIIQRAFHKSLGLGLFDKALKYSKTLSDFPSYDKNLTNYIEQTLEYLSTRDIDTNELSQIYVLVLNEIHNQLVQATYSEIINSVDNDTLILIFYVDADASAISDLQFSITDQYIDLNITPAIKQIITPVILKDSKNN